MQVTIDIRTEDRWYEGVTLEVDNDSTATITAAVMKWCDDNNVTYETWDETTQYGA